MKSRVPVLATLLAFACVSFHAAAQDAVADLLSKVPFQSTQEGEEVAAALLALGPEAIQLICDRLAPMGQGDDNAARYALSATANYVMRDEADAERGTLNAALNAALNAETEPEVKAFLLERLAITGDDTVVETVARLLTDDVLADPAARVLIAVNSPKAREAVTGAFSAAQGRPLLSLVQAAGELHASGAIPDLLPILDCKDAALRNVAITALAEIGAEESESDMMGAAWSDRYGQSRETLAIFLRYAERRLELGDTDMCARLCGVLLKETKRYKPPQETSAALSLLVRAKGAAALPGLIAATADDSPEVRAAALASAASLSGRDVIAQWLDMLPTARPEARPDIVRMLGRSGDRAVRNAVLAHLKDAGLSMRLAAIEVAPRFSGRRIVDGLLDALKQATERDEIKAIETALLQFSMEEVALPAGKMLPGLSVAGKKVLLDLLSARRATSQKEVVFACVNDPESDVRRAAIEALGNVAEEEDLPRLVGLLLDSTEDRDVKAAQKSLAVAAAQVEDEQTRIAPVMTALANTQGDKRGRLLAVLPKLDSDVSLDTVVADAASADTAVHVAALDALADWPGLAAREPILTLAAVTRDAAERERLLKGYVRIVRDSKRSEGKKLQWLGDGLELAQDAAQKRLFVNGLAVLRTVGSLRLLAGLLEEPALQKDLSKVMVDLACPKDVNDPGLRAYAVAVALGKALPFIEDEALRAKAETHIAAMPQPDAEGFVPLFNGTDLSGWTGDLSGYVVENGVIVCKPSSHANLYTDVDYADFVLRFEFKLAPGANNGLGIRTPLYGHAAYDGMELQILDDTAPENTDVKPYQYHGAIYGVAVPERGHLKPAGEWNEQEVTAKGTHVAILLNGAAILDVDLEHFRNTATPDDKEHPGLFNPSGRFALLGHGAQVEFRNIRVRELE